MTKMVDDGRLDLSLITCEAGFRETGAEILMREPLVWAMCRGGTSPAKSPLPLSVWEESCAWRNAGISGLDAAGVDWRITFQSSNISGQRAAILADLAVAPIPKSCLKDDIIEVPDKFGLPKLPDYALGLIIGKTPTAAVEAAADHLRASFGS